MQARLPRGRSCSKEHCRRQGSPCRRTHAERDGGDDDLQRAAAPGVLHRDALLGRHARVVMVRRNAALVLNAPPSQMAQAGNSALS